jgi:hypothetical protein
MSQSLTIPHLLTRMRHQFSTDLRRDRGLLLMWLLLLTVYAVEHGDVERALHGSFMPEALPMAAGLLLAWRQVRADHPGCADTAALTRPLGRGALWLAKCLLIGLLGLLPWFAVHALEWRGYGLRALSWLGVGFGVLLPACLGVFAVCWLASLRVRRGWIIASAAIAAAYLLLPMTERLAPSFFAMYLEPLKSVGGHAKDADLQRCRVVVGMSGVLLVLLWGWWRATLGSSRNWPVPLLCALCGLTAMLWPWNWCQVPPRPFTHPPLALHIGPAPQVAHQSLWSTLHVSGLAPDEVAAVVALAPIRPEAKKWPPDHACSDFVYEDEDGKMEAYWRWMNVDHARRLSGLFPPQTSWVGEADKTRDSLASVVKTAAKRDPQASQSRWRLRLAVHRLRKVQEATLAEILPGSFTASPAPGWRFDVIKHRMAESSLSLETRLRQRWPRTVANVPFRPLKVLGKSPVVNLLLTVHAPCIQQVICLHERPSVWPDQDTFWRTERHRPCDFSLSLPIIHQAITGLKTADWLRDARLALWWPDELGTIDLELTAEQMAQVLAEPPKKGEKKP